MAQYTVTFSCGHTDTVEAFGKSSQREWVLEKKAQGLCEECFHAKIEADREAARQAAMVEAVDQDLPNLEGSEKQVAWALTIRAIFLEALDKWIEDNPVRADVDASPLLDAIAAIQTEPSAKWWIDNGRNTESYTIKATLTHRMRDAKDAAERLAALGPAKPVPDAPILRPEKASIELPATVAISDTTITITSPEKRDDFRDLAKAHDYHWDSTVFRWKREVAEYRGPVDERAAEIANLILALGIPVQIFDAGVREKVINGEFEPESTRWIKNAVGGEYHGWFAISFPFGNSDIYNAARNIKGSKYDRPNVVVPANQFEAVLDYADEFGFSFSPGATALVEEAKAARAAQLIVKPKTKKRAAPLRPEPVVAPGVIDASLLDDD